MTWIGRANPQRGLPASKWANPFRLGPHGDRDTVLDKYAKHLDRSGLKNDVHDLGGMTLVCQCEDKDKCHGDILIRAWDDTVQQQEGEHDAHVREHQQGGRKRQRGGEHCARDRGHRHAGPQEFRPPHPRPPAGDARGQSHILLVELFAGIGTATVAIQQLGIPAVVAACEIDPELRAFLHNHHGIPEKNIWADIREVKGNQLYKLAKDCGQHLVAVIIVAGPPCTDVAKLNRNRVGFNGRNTSLAQEAKRIAEELGQKAVNETWAAMLLMENIMGQDARDRAKFEDMMGGPAVGVHAADWGWIQRSRLFWAAVCQHGPRHADLQRTLADVSNWTIPPDTSVALRAGSWLLQYNGAKEPAEVSWENGYKALHLNDGAATTMKYGNARAFYSDGRFSAATKEFPHPEDCVDSTTKTEDRQRFREDGGRFPLATYRKANLMWTHRHEHGGKWRTRTPGETEQVMGLPPGATASMKTTQKRNTAIGNSIHVPTVRTFLWVLIAQACPQLLVAAEGSNSTAIKREVQVELLPQPSRKRRPEKIAQTIAAGQQPTGTSTKQLIPDGLGYEGFLRTVRRAKHPAEEPPVVVDSMMTAIMRIADMGTAAIQWREHKMQEVRAKAIELEDLRHTWAAQLHPHVRRAIGHLHLPLLDWMVNVSGHRDTDYIRTLMEGRNVIGEIGRAYIYPPDDNPNEITVEEWSRSPGKRNSKVLQNIKSTNDADLDKLSWEKTLAEIDAGYCRILDQAELDMEKCCITGRFPKWEQKADGRWSVRNISNWRESGGNSATAMRERYMPDDLTTAYNVVRILRSATRKGTILNAYKCDWSMAFRQTPTRPDQARLTLEATWNPQGRRVEILEVYGQPFGGKGSQYNFIRDPAALVHFGRQFLGLVIAHYADDTWGIEPEATCLQAYTLWKELHKLTGWKLDEGKSPPPARTCTLLGGELHVGWEVPFATNTQARLNKLCQECHTHQTNGRLTAGDAAHLAGALGFATTLWWGKKGRAALQPLRVRQFYKGPPVLNPALQECLAYWIRETQTPQPRPILLSTHRLPLHITITDGEGTGWVGLLYLRPRQQDWVPEATRVRLPDAWRKTWQQDKTTDINEIEAASAPIALATWPTLADGLWLHFVDNTSAQHTLARGSSRVTSLNRIANHTWATCAERHLLLWTERVATGDNPTDGLSRGTDATHGEAWKSVEARIPQLY